MHAAPASAARPRFDIADIVQRHRAALEAEQHLTLAQRRVLSDIERCRTAALGGHLDVCRSCGFEQPVYNSCRNRHCPKCQAYAQDKWIAARSERLLPVRHFHVVFTLPSELRPLVYARKKEVFDALFHAASRTLLALGQSRLGALLGITMVLHTWTRELLFHPHVHALVTAGGLSLDGKRWVDSRKRYLFPVQVMGMLLRGKMLAALRALHRRGVFEGVRDGADFERLMQQAAQCNWVVYAKEPFRRVEHVLEYLGRYTHRVGIANSRLLDVTDEHVVLRTKNGLTATLTPVEFLRRFILHVLPPNFVKIRHYGLLASRNVDGLLETARHLLRPSPQRAVRHELTIDTACPACGAPLTRFALPRGPPFFQRVAA